MRYAIKKSSPKKSIDFLNKEKSEMLARVRSTKSNLKSWRPEYLEQISNNLDVKSIKGFSRKMNGYIKNLNYERLISFRSVDRGNLSSNLRMVAISSEFEIEYEQSSNDIFIKFNSSSLGKIHNNETIIDKSDRMMGSFSRNKKLSDSSYIIEINNEKLAIVAKNSDRRTFIKNPFYDSHSENVLERQTVLERDVSENQNLIKLYREPSKIEYEWIITIVIFEAIYYSIDLTQ